ncbi:hypothetical protein GCM10010266_22600 [Streptomyces griseomycini]|nr:hypothetical protein GCM10010266_22600 [Streptomyces griseomycini]GGR08263.1 hypothetical protein GCM10015536_11960 [Streptomyces griseomycini]
MPADVPAAGTARPGAGDPVHGDPREREALPGAGRAADAGGRTADSGGSASPTALRGAGRGSRSGGRRPVVAARLPGPAGPVTGRSRDGPANGVDLGRPPG